MDTLNKELEKLAIDYEVILKNDNEKFNINEIKEKYEDIISVYNMLNENIKEEIDIHPAGEWLLDNIYIIQEVYSVIVDELSSNKYKKFSKIQMNDGKIIPRIQIFAEKIIQNINEPINQCVLENSINKYQEIQKFTMFELWNLGIFLQIELINQIHQICGKIYISQVEKEKVQNMYERLIEQSKKKKSKYSKINKYLTINKKEQMKNTYIEYLAYILKKNGQKTNKYLQALEQIIEMSGKDLNDIITKEHLDIANTKINIGKYILSMKNINNISFSEIFESTNEVEKNLKEDPSNIYRFMEYRTKEEYRNMVEKIAKEAKVSEIYVSNIVLNLAKKNQNESNDIEGKKKAHIGYYLIDKGINETYKILKINKTIINGKDKGKLYVYYKVAISIILNYILVDILYNNFISKIITFIILFVPVFFLVDYLVKKIMLKKVVPKVIPKMELNYTIPNELATIVIMPCIIENAEQIKEKIEKFEIYYLANKSPNIYFCLLADPKQSSMEKIGNEDDIINEGLSTVNKLNEKYFSENIINGKTNKNDKIKIFNFIYRKRKWNEFEEAYIGYERKRGYLRQFNQYILGSDIEDFITSTIDNKNIPNIKYVITLDSDTNLVLNSAFEQIGAMSHILNKPYISKKYGVVKNGYAIMQPQIDIDIEVANTNYFTKVFANSSGIDFYSNAISDIYQDICKSGIYTGKGIYDLKVFEEVLSNRIKENTILSHDLLEGELLNCGLITNTRLIDEYPKNYISYIKRKKRWIRGDVQVLAYLKEKGLSLISKYKIIDNVLREILEISILIGIFIKIIPISLLLILYLIPYYNSIKQGIIELSLLPYSAYIELESIVKALYRMKISHKKMLEWATFEECEKKQKNDLNVMYKNLFVNVIFAIILIIFRMNIISILLAILWILAPYMMYILQNSSKNENKKAVIKEEDKNYLMNLGRDTWNFFENYINEDTNYLIPDNYQENRRNKIVYRTSSTNIGLSLLACVSAYDLNYINKEKLYNYIEKILNVIEELDKWHGHLYNWYDIKSKKPLFPHVVSTVDSGNFIGYLYTLIGFLEEKENEDKEIIEYWIKRIKEIINKTDFSKLYSVNDRLFSIAYDESQDILLKNYYDLLASEARQASYIAIAKKDVPAKHWLNLGRTMTRINNDNGLVSWSGTSFEYLMPNINIPTYKESILEKSCDLMIKAQMNYCKKLNIPWGISEAAFNLKDLYSNYQYKAFGVPWLGLKRGLSDEKVVASYGSIMAITKYPKEVIENIKNLESKEMYSKYGLYESIDFTENRLSHGKEYEVVKTYMAHHQALILLSLNNLFNDDVLQKRFLSIPEIEASKILLQEKMPDKILVTKDNKNAGSKENKIKYKDYMSYMKVEYDENNQMNRANLNISNCISNNGYTIILDKYGEGFSKFNNIYINRYKKDREVLNGIQTYIKDEDKNIWRIGKDNKSTEAGDSKSKIVVYSNKTKIEKLKNDIRTTLINVVSPNDPIEIRKIEIENISYKDKKINIYMLLEPILSSLEQDYSHPVFNNLFLGFEYLEKEKVLIVKRRKRNDDEQNIYLAITVTNLYNNKFEFEIDKSKVYKRGDVYVPQIIKSDKKFSNSVNLVTEPIVCIKNDLEIPAKNKLDIYYMLSVGFDKQEVINSISKNYNINEIERNIKLSKIKAEEENRYLGIIGEEELIYQKILKYTILYNPYRQKEILKYTNNKYQREDIWKYGISGDLPIIYLSIEEINDIENVKQLLKCYEYIKNKNIEIDICIAFPMKLKSNVEVQVNNRHLGYLKNIKGGIYLLEKEHVAKENLELIEILSNIYIDSRKGDIKNIINDLEEKFIQENKSDNTNKILKKYIKQESTNEEISNNDFESEYINDGKEYRIVIDNKNRLPTIWCNIMANKNFGTIVTENMGGYTWNNNSRLNRITAWNNSPNDDMPQELIYIKEDKDVYILNATPIKNEQKFEIVYGFGYSVYKSEIKNIEIIDTIFIPINDNMKIDHIKLKNKEPQRRKISIYKYIKPVLGENETKNDGNIFVNIDKNNNLLYIENILNKEQKIVYLNSNCDIISFTGNNQEFKPSLKNPIGIYNDELSNNSGLGNSSCAVIQIEVELESFEEKNISFILGEENSKEEVIEKIKEYNNIQEVEKSLKDTIKYWKKITETLKVSTPSNSLNYMLNGWCIYQLFTSRLWGRSGYYQSGGAYGFRDQLQDVMSLKYIDSDIIKEQIKLHASKQFKEGDVLHWWHEEKNNGIRTKISDDRLWMIYVLDQYIKFTGDYNILDIEIPYLEGEVLKEEEEDRYQIYSNGETKETLLEHCRKAMDLSLQLGENGLPKIGTGDWNDSLNKIGDKGKGESFWLGFFLCDVLDKFIELLKYKELEKKEYEEKKEKLKKILNDYGWDGEWYKRAITDDGRVIGSNISKECKIDSITQSWAAISGAGESNKVNSALESVEKYLIDKDAQAIKLLTPPFEKEEFNPGYIKSYIPGTRENGGQYTHAAIWYIYANCILGRGTKAVELYDMVNPINHTKTKEEKDRYKVEPYCIPADIYTNDDMKGRGGWTWYTGSASWYYLIGIEKILGFNIENKHIILRPCISKEWKEYNIQYKYYESVYNIKIKNPEGKETGISKIYLDGVEVENNIKLDGNPKVYNIEAIM